MDAFRNDIAYRLRTRNFVKINLVRGNRERKNELGLLRCQIY
jgi:RNA-binding protein YhbY